jgi:hypothetical protein
MAVLLSSAALAAGSTFNGFSADIDVNSNLLIHETDFLDTKEKKL